MPFVKPGLATPDPGHPGVPVVPPRPPCAGEGARNSRASREVRVSGRRGIHFPHPASVAFTPSPLSREAGEGIPPGPASAREAPALASGDGSRGPVVRGGPWIAGARGSRGPGDRGSVDREVPPRPPAGEGARRSRANRGVRVSGRRGSVSLTPHWAYSLPVPSPAGGRGDHHRARGLPGAGYAARSFSARHCSWTTMTGQRALRTVLSATEPTSAWARPVQPWVPITTRSKPYSSA